MTELHPDPTRPYMLYLMGRAICRLITTMTFDLKVYGAEHVPQRGGALLLSNHQSYIDPACIGAKLKRPLSFLAKSELFEVPVFGRIIPRLNAFPVHQGAGDIHAVRETIARLKEGHVLTVFPEGSRTDTGEMMPLQPGFALIVRRAGVPIVPVGIDGAFQAWRRGTPMFRPHPVRVKFGPAMKVDHLKPAEIVTTVESKIRELIADLRVLRAAEMRDALSGPVALPLSSLSRSAGTGTKQ